MATKATKLKLWIVTIITGDEEDMAGSLTNSVYQVLAKTKEEAEGKAQKAELDDLNETALAEGNDSMDNLDDYYNYYEITATELQLIPTLK